MKVPKEDSKLREDENKLSLTVRDNEPIYPIIQRAKDKGWKQITIKGSSELCRACWIEASMAGIAVKGYSPTPTDRDLIERFQSQNRLENGTLLTRADYVVRDYATRVIPFLEKEYETLRIKRAKLGITTTDLDRAYGLNTPVGFNREIDDRFVRAKGALIRALDARDYFLQRGNKQVCVRNIYEDGVSRFIALEDGNKRITDLKQERGIRR